MRNKRALTREIIAQDKFTGMEHGSQLLYVLMVLDADDDGFVDNVNKIMKLTELKKEHLTELLRLRYVLTFESGIHVIKHWSLHNSIRRDMYKPTKYLEEKKTLETKDNGVYTELRNEDGTKPLPNLIQSNLIKSNIAEAETSDPKEKIHNEFIPLIMKEFESINPACKKMYGNKTQRAAAAFLYDTYGFERIKRIVSVWLPKTNGEPYFPTITTPVQLQQKFAQLEAAVKKKHTEAGKSKNQVAF